MQEVALKSCLYTSYKPIDDDHVKIINLLNELREASHNEVNELVIKICEEIDRHASHEEHLMFDFKYDQVDMILHMADHHDQFTRIKAFVTEGKLNEAMTELGRHILKYDVKLGIFLKEKQEVMVAVQ